MILNNQDNELIKFYCKTQLPTWTEILQKDKYEEQFNIELVIHADCNQTCEYCYIYKYGDQLYPKANRCSREQILKNIQMLCDYWFENEVFPYSFSLFAGDLFYDDFFYDVVNIIYNFYKNIEIKYPDFVQIIREKSNNPDYPIIVVPCNFSFCRHKEKIIRLENLIEQYKNDIDLAFGFSYSGDGKYVTDTRERTEVSDELYDTIFSLMKRQPMFGAHPMIAACNIKHWIENYDWWLEQTEKYFPETTNFQPSMLEVRNDDWTDESIADYLKLLEHIINKRFEIYNNDLDKFIISVLSHDGEKYGLEKVPGNIDPIFYHILTPGCDNHMSCDIGFSFIVNCYDLSIIPCHRLAYPYLSGGHFEVQDNKIIDIKANEGINCYFNSVLHVNHYKVKCASCDYRNVCLKGCEGAQYEAYGDYNIPIESVCKMFQAKIDFLTKKYHELGIFHRFFKDDLPIENQSSDRKKVLLDFLLKKGYNEYEQYTRND